MKDLLENIKNLNKKTVLIVSGILIVIISLTIFILSNRESLFDLNGLMNEESVPKNEEQEEIHSLILRNSVWDSSFEDIAIEEKGNIIDYGDNYITCDYESLFGITWLPTYLLKNGKLVGIIYEANLGVEEINELSSVHQDVAVNIHYVYEQLYRENNKWTKGMDRAYDKELWTNSLLNGDLSMQSIWNSTNEKIFLVTNNKALFEFLNNEKGSTKDAYMTFAIISDNYLLENSFDKLLNIVPGNSDKEVIEIDGETVELISSDENNAKEQVGTTTEYQETGEELDLTDEEFDAIFNEITNGGENNLDMENGGGSNIDTNNTDNNTGGDSGSSSGNNLNNTAGENEDTSGGNNLENSTAVEGEIPPDNYQDTNTDDLFD